MVDIFHHAFHVPFRTIIYTSLWFKKAVVSSFFCFELVFRGLCPKCKNGTLSYLAVTGLYFVNHMYFSAKWPNKDWQNFLLPAVPLQLVKVSNQLLVVSLISSSANELCYAIYSYSLRYDFFLWPIYFPCVFAQDD